MVQQEEPAPFLDHQKEGREGIGILMKVIK
jgi:hypothetical protein